MHEFLQTNPIIHGVYHSLVILPLLYLAYVLMELIEHKASSRFKNALQEDRRTGSVIGATVGLLPLCGFADLGAGLYAGRVISLGTLVALFIGTSGEILLLAAGCPDKILALVVLLLLKYVIACLCGFILDFCLRNKQSDIHIHELCEEKHCECKYNNIWLSALKHTVPVFVLVLGCNLLIGIFEFFGLIENFAYIIETLPALGIFFATLIGVIPGCAPLVLLFSLWNSELLSSAAFLAGLITSVGSGYIVLFKTNKKLKQNFMIVVFILAIALFVGILFEATGGLKILNI